MMFFVEQSKQTINQLSSGLKRWTVAERLLFLIGYYKCIHLEGQLIG